MYYARENGRQLCSMLIMAVLQGPHLKNRFLLFSYYRAGNDKKWLFSLLRLGTYFWYNVCVEKQRHVDVAWISARGSQLARYNPSLGLLDGWFISTGGDLCWNLSFITWYTRDLVAGVKEPVRWFANLRGRSSVKTRCVALRWNGGVSAVWELSSVTLSAKQLRLSHPRFTFILLMTLYLPL